MEFRLPFIEDIQRFQVKKPFYGENITFFVIIFRLEPDQRVRYILLKYF